MQQATIMTQATDVAMEGLEGSLIMAHAALNVKNKAIDMLNQELQGLRRENDDLFKAVLQGPAPHRAALPPTAETATQSGQAPAAQAAANAADAPNAPNAPSTAAVAAAAAATSPAPAPAAGTATQTAAEAEAVALRQQLQEAQQQAAARDAEMAALRAALAESRGTIHALEAELQDTMEAAMQLWDTVQAGPLSEAASSRPGSLYQEQVSPLSFAATDLSPLPPAGDGEETPWRTPSASPSPPATAAAANGQQGLIRSADATPRRAGRDTGAAAGEVGGSQQHSVGVSPRVLRSSGEGQLPSGFFTPIETRVQSLASKLRAYMLHQPGVEGGLPTGRSLTSSLHSPRDASTEQLAAGKEGYGSSGTAAAAQRVVAGDADVSVARDTQQ